MKRSIFNVLIVMMVLILLALIGFAVYGMLGQSQAISNIPSPAAKITFVAVTNTPLPQPGATRLNPSLAVLPVQGEADLLISVTGENWLPGDDSLLVQIEAPQSHQNLPPIQKEAKVTSGGAFLAAFILPADSDWAQLSQVKVTAQSRATGDRLAVDFVTSGLYPPTPTVTATYTYTPSPTPTETALPTSTPLPTPTSTPFSIVDKLTPFPPELEPQRMSTFPAVPHSPLVGEWRGEYYANPNLSGLPLLIRSEPGLNFDWGSSSPAAELPVDGFSARWSRSTEFAPGRYRFTLIVAGGARLWANGQVLIDAWQDEGLREVVRDYIAVGGLSQITVEYANQQGEARIRYSWEAVDPTPALPQAPVVSDAAALTTAVSASRTDLARRTGLPVEDVEVVSVKSVTWQNSNLACTTVQPGFQVIIPGFLIYLESDGVQYEYHTDGGSYVLLCGLYPTDSAQPVTPKPPSSGNQSP